MNPFENILKLKYIFEMFQIQSDMFWFKFVNLSLYAKFAGPMQPLYDAITSKNAVKANNNSF